MRSHGNSRDDDVYERSQSYGPIRFGCLNSTHVKTPVSDQRPAHMGLVGHSESLSSLEPLAYVNYKLRLHYNTKT